VWAARLPLTALKRRDPPTTVDLIVKRIPCAKCDRDPAKLRTRSGIATQGARGRFSPQIRHMTELLHERIEAALDALSAPKHGFDKSPDAQALSSRSPAV
jgi:hypothetical protein